MSIGAFLFRRYAVLHELVEDNIPALYGAAQQQYL